MQIRNKIYIRKYVFGTILNLLWPPFLFGFEALPYVLMFFIAIFLNQYFLIIVGADLLGIEKNRGILPTWLCALLKLVILIIGFYVFMKIVPGKEIFVVLLYKIQLIIFVLSIKRVVKKT